MTQEATQASAADDCLFCEVSSRPQEELRWHDRPLLRIPSVGAIIAGLGAFVPGYVLVFPERHIQSTLQLSPEFNGAFDNLARMAVRTVQNSFGPVTIFEHGSCCQTQARRSACIDHAHVHIIPGDYRLADYIEGTALSEREAQKNDELGRSGYLFLQEPSDTPKYWIDPGESQFFRRRIAANLGIANDWDYLLFPRFENVRATIEELRNFDQNQMG